MKLIKKSDGSYLAINSAFITAVIQSNAESISVEFSSGNSWGIQGDVKGFTEFLGNSLEKTYQPTDVYYNEKKKSLYESLGLYKRAASLLSSHIREVRTEDRLSKRLIEDLVSDGYTVRRDGDGDIISW